MLLGEVLVMITSRRGRLSSRVAHRIACALLRRAGRRFDLGILVPHETDRIAFVRMLCKRARVEVDGGGRFVTVLGGRGCAS